MGLDYISYSFCSAVLVESEVMRILPYAMRRKKLLFEAG